MRCILTDEDILPLSPGLAIRLTDVDFVPIARGAVDVSGKVNIRLSNTELIKQVHARYL